MNPAWTPSASASLERFLEETRRQHAEPGVDPDEIAADLRRHVEQDLAQAGLAVVTEADLNRVLARLNPEPIGVKKAGPVAGLVGSNSQRPTEALPTPAAPGPRPPKRWYPFLTLLFGVVLPLIAIGVELGTGMCAEEFFDPLATWLHVLLVASVPLAHGVAWVWLKSGKTALPAWLWWANAWAMGVGTFYTLVFAPLLPPAFIAVIFYGLGFLPMAPGLSLLGGWLLRRGLRQTASTPQAQAPRGWVWAYLAPLVALVLQVLPSWATRQYAHVAISGSPEAPQAVQWLRRWGDRDQLLRDSYGPQRNPLLNVLTQPLFESSARELFFRVTGQPFNAVKPPVSLQARRNRFLLEDWALAGNEWDGALGGEAVAGQVRGLALASSRLDGLIGADEATSYVEWTLEFRNDHERSDREARAQIQLPPGGVVSRLTLWVNGEEREAAFAGRSEVRQAYQQVAVVKRRDPVLVSTCGPDRILVQCFPVPARGGRMKVRLGITAPLHLPSAEEGIFQWPVMLERNFTLAPDLRHSAWLEASQPLSAGLPQLTPDNAKPDRPGLRGELTDAELADPRATVHVRRHADVRLAWSEDAVTGEGAIVEQRFESSLVPPPSRVAWVLDGSVSMEGEFERLSTVLEKLPAGVEPALYIAADEVRAFVGREAWSQALAHFRQLHGVGGQDNVPALIQAWDWAAAQPGGVVIWVHGPQPVALSGSAGLRQRLEWRSGPAGPPIWDVSIRPGPNRIAEALDGLDGWRSARREGTAPEILAREMVNWSGPREVWRLVRERSIRKGQAATRPGKHGSGHLVRLWALEELKRRVAERQLTEAAALGARYQLVTSQSGAVVLENAAQYSQNGLQPVDPATVPVVPEPGTVALFVTGMVALVAWKRRSGGPTSQEAKVP